MVKGTRGHTSHTYDIKTVIAVDLERLTIKYTDAAHAAPQAVTLNIDNPTDAARQALQALADSLRVHGNGDIESAYALGAVVRLVQRLVVETERLGFTSFGDPLLGIDQLRDAVNQFDDGPKRTLNKLLGRILRAHHPQGAQLARALANTSYMAREPRTEPYDEAVADAIERAARAVFTDAVSAQRDVMRTLGYDVSDRGWLGLPAEDIIGRVRAEYPHLDGDARPPRSTAPAKEIAAWVLMHPARFARANVGKRTLVTLPRELQQVGDAVHPSAPVLVAALIIQCLAQDLGFNLSTMLRTEPSDLAYTGTDQGVLLAAKARNHSEDYIPVRIESMFSTGGLIATLSGLTRFSRHYRAERLSKGNQVPEVVNRLYVEHVLDPARAEILTNTRMHNAWRSKPFDDRWPNPDINRADHGLAFRALRTTALKRKITDDPDGDVHGHNERTRLHYLAHVLPDHVLTTQATAAQDDILNAALARFPTVDEADSGAAEALAGIDADQMLDMVTSVCTSAGNDPDDTTKPCSLGLAACFTCPNGYRTADHVPGLLAVLAYTEIIRDNDPDEWETGDAGTLHFYASESLKQFPRTLVDTVKNTNDLTNQIVNIHGLYTELRR